MDNLVELEIIYPQYLKESRFSQTKTESDKLLQAVLTGNYAEGLKNKLSQNALKFSNGLSGKFDSGATVSEFYENIFESYLMNNKEIGEQVLYCIAISCLQIFVQNNFCGPFLGPPSNSILPNNLESGSIYSTKDVLEALSSDSEDVYELISEPIYLLISKVIFSSLRHRLTSCCFINWWCIRYCIIHQKILDEFSFSLHEIILECTSHLEENLISKPFFKSIENLSDIEALFHIEISYINLEYGFVGKAKYHIEKALSILSMEIELTGSLGVRTKWQQNQLAQLVLKVKYKENSISQSTISESHLLHSDLPKDIILNDDTRLNKVKFQEIDEDVIPNLKPLEQLALFAHLMVRRKSQAHDTLLVEESKAYLRAVLQYPKNWILQLSSLNLRSKIELKEMRAMDRSLSQFEECVYAIKRDEPSRFERLKLFYACSMLSSWSIKQDLAKLYMKMGCVKTALEIFEDLHLWDDVITCYNELEMRQRSAEIIKELLNKEETPKLWCLLGDATDSIDCYLKAWDLSKQKSGRAQRSLGNYYFHRKEFLKAYEHYKISVKINSIQFQAWQRLAHCALQTEQFEECVKAYKRCVTLEPDSFESWNNMSQAHLKLGETFYAWKSLQEALKCQMDNWKIWDNFMLVSTSLGYMMQAVNAYNRILAYKEKHIDTEILGRIVNAVILNKNDPDGKPTSTLRKDCLELIGKLNREVPSNGELWFLNAELLYTAPDSSQESRHTAMQYYRKAVACDTQKLGWDKDTTQAILVLNRALKLIKIATEICSKTSAKAGSADLSSMRMLLKSIIYSVKKNQVNEFGEILESVKLLLNEVETGLLTINNLIVKLNETK